VRIMCIKMAGYLLVAWLLAALAACTQESENIQGPKAEQI
jgi:hypothetical protein